MLFTNTLPGDPAKSGNSSVQCTIFPQSNEICFTFFIFWILVLVFWGMSFFIGQIGESVGDQFGEWWNMMTFYFFCIFGAFPTIG